MKMYRVTSVTSFFAVAVVLSFSGCEQQYQLHKTVATAPATTQVAPAQPASPTTPVNPVTPVTPTTPTISGGGPTQPTLPVTPVTPVVPVVSGPKSAIAVETFNAATNAVKKIDFLFVVDNSGSMSDNQKKLARGFRAFANTFYRRADLDICTMIITSDRYLGKESETGYQRERSIPCTKPAGSANWSPAQMQAHIDALIEDFQEKVYVGVYGSGVELVGKSLVSFLYGLNQWGDRTDVSAKTNFFRKDAVANISLVSDENNYFFEELEKTDESANDLPHVTGVAIPYAKNGQVDTRKGIKNYVDEFFTAVNPDRGLSYSLTSIIDITRSAETIPGIAVNLEQLPASIGRESQKADISGPVETFTDVYQSIADAIVLRATAYTLKNPVAGDLLVRVLRTNGDVVILSSNSDYVLENPTTLTLTPGILPLLQGGDRIQVSYRYLLK